MGLLTLGSPMSWDETKQYCDLVRQKGIRQFINLYRKLKDRKHDCLKWGDEVEFCIVKFDHEHKRCYLLLKAHELLPILQGPEERHQKTLTLWRPEYANYMLEGTPGQPYEHEISCLNRVEANMRLRRNQILELLGENEYVFSLTAFPLLGCRNFTWPNYSPTPRKGITHSLFYPDEAIYTGHPRFNTLSVNIRARRKSKVAINIPIFVDKNTPQPFVEDLIQYGDVDDSESESKRAAKPNHIYLDAMGFGMGCSCLQMTFQAQSIDEARLLYDQLTPLTPILLALSASSPIWRGYLSEVDCRWNVISGSVDDRTLEERGELPLNENRHRIFKSRYDSIDCYLSEEGAKYNDIPVVIDDELYKTLTDNGIDHLLAQHIAHLFIRDPVALYKEKLDIDDETETDHFENIQSTNWQTMRFKPPPTNSPIGWRVEFRPMELQLTDFENAALVTFMVLLTRAILSFNLNMLIPISKVDENMQVAQKRNACLGEKFYFRKSIERNDKSSCTGQSSASASSEATTSSSTVTTSDDDEVALMTVNEIVNGSDQFPGMIQLIKDYLSNLNVDVDTQCTIRQYLQFIGDRASGNLMTSASWMRKFVLSHPKYAHDSRVTPEITYDLLWRIKLISSGEIKCPELVPAFNTKTRVV